MTDRVNDRLNDRLNSSMKGILEQLYIDPGYSVTELSKLLGISRTTVSNSIKKLKNQGIIERVGNNKKGYWKIKR